MDRIEIRNKPEFGLAYKVVIKQTDRNKMLFVPMLELLYIRENLDKIGMTIEGFCPLDKHSYALFLGYINETKRKVANVILKEKE